MRLPGAREARNRTWLRRRTLEWLARVVDRAGEERPFFGALKDLLDREPDATLGRLLDEAGEQVYGLTVLLLALLTFIPGVANVLSLATLLVGLQMLWGSPHPWLPRALQGHVLHRGRIKELLGQIEARLEWFLKRPRIRRRPSLRFLGFLVAWAAFIAALPIPLPFANALPAAALVLMGVALLEEWPRLAWFGALLTLTTTVYFALSFELAWKATQALFRSGAG
ncbi:MAG: exopolysaccharide biosynthesis protein [Acidobacteria bacterium]|nr:exopolysaccharide biosynthesis protein [Acidobacteriota bacterium]